MKFFKYHGAGNDFIIIDNRKNDFINDEKIIQKLCHRRFGIGADGLMILNSSNKFDFEMKYFNSDGKEGSMCGNGGRCIVAFAKKIGIIQNSAKFLAYDGLHEAFINENNIVNLKMSDVKDITFGEKYYFLNTGSPHYVEFVENLSDFDVFTKGKSIRNNLTLFENGTNVNFAEIENTYVKIRTFERGVEDETLACGTGCVATALAYTVKTGSENNFVNLRALGGDLKVTFEKKGNCITNIWLEGTTEFVYDGDINV